MATSATLLAAPPTAGFQKCLPVLRWSGGSFAATSRCCPFARSALPFAGRNRSRLCYLLLLDFSSRQRFIFTRCTYLPPYEQTVLFSSETASRLSPRFCKHAPV